MPSPRHNPPGSRFNIGYSTGMFDSLLTSLDIPYTRVNAAVWKRQMGLFKKGKPGSMALAPLVMPASRSFLTCVGRGQGRTWQSAGRRAALFTAPVN